MPKGIYKRKPRTTIRSDKGTTRNSYSITWIHSKHENVFVTGQQKNKLPPLEILNWLFRYEESSGKLFKVRESSGKAVEPAREITHVDSKGYLCASITDSSGLEKMFKVHHLIYFMVTGIEPLQIVDHLNGIPSDNRFSNLRLATDSINQRNRGMHRNNTSGITGVSWYELTGKWVARANESNGKTRFLGYYLDKGDAARVISEYYSNPENNYSYRHGL